MVPISSFSASASLNKLTKLYSLSVRIVLLEQVTQSSLTVTLILRTQTENVRFGDKQSTRHNAGDCVVARTGISVLR